MKTYFPDEYIAAMVEHCDWAKNPEAHNVFPVSTSSKPPVPSTNASPVGVISISHWIGLHEYVWNSESEARSFFAGWWEGRPKTCKCKGAEAILAANPMDFSSDEQFFASGVRLHNAVSAKPELADTHPQMSVEEAQIIWKTRSGKAKTK